MKKGTKDKKMTVNGFYCDCDLSSYYSHDLFLIYHGLWIPMILASDASDYFEEWAQESES